MNEIIGDIFWFLLGVMIGTKFGWHMIADYTLRKFGEEFGDAVNAKTKGHQHEAEIRRVCLEALREMGK